MDKKKVYITPNFREMRIVENPFLPKQTVPCVIEKPEDVEKYWDDFTDCYMFGKLVIQCSLDLSEYSITATSITTNKTLLAQSITCEGDIVANKIKAQEINCVSIVAEEVYVDTLIYSDVCCVNNLSVITLHPATAKAVNKSKNMTQRKA